jgi:hypothetical protein
MSPRPGGGAPLEAIMTEQATRIQSVADRAGVTIILVGSRAADCAGPMSDYDCILVGANARLCHSLRRWLPAAPSGLGEPRNQDFHPEPLDPNRPHIIFEPRGA